MPKLLIGCSGFNYRHWLGNFYPEGLSQRQWFTHYCSFFSCVELNVTFYRLLKPATFEHWREVSPAKFSFAVKGSRYLTHIKRLKEPEQPLERFFEGVLLLEDKLGTILWQLPPNLACDAPRLKHFFQLIKTYHARHAFEFRNESWLLSAETIELCREFNIALCMADAPAFIDRPPLTADFVYIRRHGHDQSYSGCYSSQELAADAERITGYQTAGRDVEIYFNNDLKGYAPQNALELAGMLYGKEEQQ